MFSNYNFFPNYILGNYKLYYILNLMLMYPNKIVQPTEQIQRV